MPAQPRATPDPTRFVMISGYHDYRSKRRANLHFITDELALRGSVFFLSLRYSYLTRLTEDPRHALWDRANRLEQVGAVACYLWRTTIHACRLPRWLGPLERALFAAFASRLPNPARDAIAAADTVFIESGIAIVHLPLIRRLAPRAQIVYLASDALGAINQAESIKAAFRRHAHLVDSARLPSPLLRDDIPASIPCYYIPHGVEKERFASIGPSPYPAGTRNAVSVGSMLFDPTFFRIAAPMFPEITFHIIGSGHKEAGPPNVVYLPEMPFAETLPYIKHADFAVAPYNDGVASYLTHTSMKLMQYGYLGVPAVCPETVAAGERGRFGYKSGSPASIAEAIKGAFESLRSLPPTKVLDWGEVVERLLRPKAFVVANDRT